MTLLSIRRKRRTEKEKKMKKVLSNKKVLLVLLAVAAMFLLAGCQRNVDGNGNTLPERIISLDTPWKNVLNESFFSAIFVWPLAQCINWLGTKLNSAVLGVLVTTVAFNLLTLGLSKKSTISQQKMQMMQPELQKTKTQRENRHQKCRLSTTNTESIHLDQW